MGWLVLLFVLMVYMLTAPGHLQTIDMSSQLAVGRSLVEHLTFTAPGGLGVQGLHGIHYSKHAIGESLLLLPVVILGELVPRADMGTVTAFAASLLTAAVAAAAVSILFLFALDLGARVRTAAVTALIFAFCTMQWSYAHDAFDITPTGCCLLLALFAAHRMRLRRPGRWLLVSGWALACAILLRVPSAALMPIYGLYVYQCWPCRTQSARLIALCRWSLPTLAVLAFTGWYDWVRFGTPLETGYGIGSSNGFTFPLWQGLAGLLISPGKSIFLYSPVLVLAFIGYPSFVRRDRSLALAVLAIAVVTVFFYARFHDWSGDWAWGPRFMLPFIPLLLLAIIGVVETWATWNWRLRAGAGLLISASIAVQLLGILVDYQVQMEIELFNGTLPQMYWSPRYSQIAVHADVVWHVLQGTAIYPAVRLPKLHILRPSHPINWDFWWLTAWHANANRLILASVLALMAATAVLIGVRLVRGLAHGSGAETRTTDPGELA
jgi:hypothetical protein